MAILDDLKGILSPAEFAKIEANEALRTKVTRGDELRSYYDGEEPPVQQQQQQQEPPPVQRTLNPPGQFDLGAIERMLDSKLKTINTTVETQVAEIVKTRGDELVNNAVKISLQRADELNRIYARHERETGKPFDSAEFNAYLEKPEIKAKGFRTITDAYDSFIEPVARQKAIDDGVKAGIAAQSGQNVPGTTPPPASNSNIRVFMKRGANGTEAPTTGAGRAAAALDKIMSRQAEMAS